jgi:hypothetical protein
MMMMMGFPPDPPPTRHQDGHEQEPGLRLWRECVEGCGALGNQAGDGSNLGLLVTEITPLLLDDAVC